MTTNFKQVAIDSLVPYAKNSRNHPPGQIDQIAASIKEFGFLSPCVISADNTIIAGHGRVMAAKKLGIETVPCVVADHLTDAQRRAYVLIDNRLTDTSEWDKEMLKIELADLTVNFPELDLPVMGFSPEEIEALGLNTIDAEVVGLTDEDAVPEAPKTPTTKTGDIWLLGNHRVMCGDSTDAGSVALLMNGEKADLCFTSPPYALGKSMALSGNKSMSKKKNPYNDHDDNEKQWADLMQRWFAASDSAVIGAWVVNLQPLAGNKRDLVRFIAENCSRLVDIATWDKGHAAPVMAQGVMSSRFEWLIIFSAEHGASRSIPLSSWQGTVQSVYSAPPQRNNEFCEIHAATMPVHVPEWVMSTLCDKAKSVYEPFCGTGTTTIAAEKLGRSCFGMELSPQYCDVIIKRWQDFTGRLATLEGDGRTFEEIQRERVG